MNKKLLEEARDNFRKSIYHTQGKKLIENISQSIISDIKEIYEHAEDFSETRAENLITISFTLSGTGTSFEEVEGDMDTIAESHSLIVSDFSAFCEEGQDIDCDNYLGTGQPVDFCVSFEYINGFKESI